MLTYGQLKLIFVFYRICYKFCLLPLKFDNLTCSCTTGIRYFVWKLQYLLASALGIFKAIRLFDLLFVNSEEINLIYFSLHAALSVMGVMNCVYSTVLFTHMENQLLLTNQGLLEVKGQADEKDGLYRLGKDLLYLWKFSAPEILLLVLPFVMISSPTVFIPFIYFLQHDSPQFLYSLCPQEYRSIPTVILFGVPELWLICNWFSINFHFGFLTSMLLQKSIDISKEEMARFGRGTIVKPRKVVRRYRQFLLQTQIYNYMAPGIIYMAKLLFMTMAVLGFFIAIRFGSQLPLLITATNLVMGVFGIFLYNFLYDAAVWMPSKFDDLKNCLYSSLTKEEAVLDRANIRRELASLPAVELRVGFDSFTPTTTPEFIDFVVQQICSLLLTF